MNNQSTLIKTNLNSKSCYLDKFQKCNFQSKISHCQSKPNELEVTNTNTSVKNNDAVEEESTQTVSHVLFF